MLAKSTHLPLCAGSRGLEEAKQRQRKKSLLEPPTLSFSKALSDSSKCVKLQLTPTDNSRLTSATPERIRPLHLGERRHGSKNWFADRRAARSIDQPCDQSRLKLPGRGPAHSIDKSSEAALTKDSEGAGRKQSQVASCLQVFQAPESNTT